MLGLARLELMIKEVRELKSVAFVRGILGAKTPRSFSIGIGIAIGVALAHSMIVAQLANPHPRVGALSELREHGDSAIETAV